VKQYQSYIIVSLLTMTLHTNAETIRSYSAGELVERAVQRNSNLEAMKLDVAVQRSASEQAGRFQDPALGLGFDHRRQYPGNGSRGNQNTGSTGFGRISLSQELSRPGRLRALEKSESYATDAIETSRKKSEIEVRGLVLQLIYNFKIADEKARHAKERYARFATVETFMRSRPFVAPQSRAEVSIVKTKLLALQKIFRQLEAGRKVAWNNLNLYQGFAEEVKVQAEWISKPHVYQQSDIASKSASKNLDIRRQAILVDQESQALKAARLTTWPGLTLTGEYTDGSGANPERTYSLGISLPVPVFNGNRSAIGAAVFAKSAEEQRLAWARRKVDRDIQSAFSRYEAASATLTDLSVAKLQSLESDMRETDQGFKKGQVDLLTYLENDAQHFDTVFAILDTQSDYLAALTDLLLLVGEAPSNPEGT